VYDLPKLEQAGLISKVGNEAGTAAYTAEEFELTLTVRETEVSITPAKIIEVIAQKNEYRSDRTGPRRPRNRHIRTRIRPREGDSEGDVTIRQIASLTDLFLLNDV